VNVEVYGLILYSPTKIKEFIMEYVIECMCMKFKIYLTQLTGKEPHSPFQRFCPFFKL